MLYHIAGGTVSITFQCTWGLRREHRLLMAGYARATASLSQGSGRDFAKPCEWATVPAGCWGPPVSWGQWVPLSKVPGMQIWKSPGAPSIPMPACWGPCTCMPWLKFVLTLGQRSDSCSWQAKGIYSTVQSSHVLFPLRVSGCLSPTSSSAPLGSVHFNAPASPTDAPRGTAGRHAELLER